MDNSPKRETYKSLYLLYTKTGMIDVNFVISKLTVEYITVTL